jgi:cytochrome b pre-mRNA-processing protein 3
MLLDGLRARKDAPRAVARALHDQAVAQSRAPELYASMGVADTPEGRFETLTLHVCLLLARLDDGGADSARLRQDVFDVYIGDLDGALREMGVSDLSVGRRMRRLVQAFYGRAQALDEAFTSLPDQVALRGVVGRTLLQERQSDDPGPLADYILECRAALADGATVDLLDGRAKWPTP